MLVLTRKVGKSLVIGNDIKITIVEIKGSQVKIGIDAPSEYIIHREEVYQKILDENRQASEVGELNLQSISKFWKESSHHDSNS